MRGITSETDKADAKHASERGHCGLRPGTAVLLCGQRLYVCMGAASNYQSGPVLSVSLLRQGGALQPQTCCPTLLCGASCAGAYGSTLSYTLQSAII